MILLGIASTIFFLAATFPPVARLFIQAAIILIMGTAMSLYFMARTLDGLLNTDFISLPVRALASWLITAAKKMARWQVPGLVPAGDTGGDSESARAIRELTALQPLPPRLQVRIVDVTGGTTLSLDDLQHIAHYVLADGVVVFRHKDGDRAFLIFGGKRASAPLVSYDSPDIVFDRDIGDLQHRLAANYSLAYNAAVRAIAGIEGTFHAITSDGMVSFRELLFKLDRCSPPKVAPLTPTPESTDSQPSPPPPALAASPPPTPASTPASSPASTPASTAQRRETSVSPPASTTAAATAATTAAIKTDNAAPAADEIQIPVGTAKRAPAIVIDDE